jgi:bifunctional UDP-N-acetylglucosamine pyrophosphorylase/glucosamine-1-phosphate N-acetyltransferase
LTCATTPAPACAASCVCGQDVEIDVGCIFTGRVELGEGVQVGAHCCIANARIAAGAVIHPYTHIDGEKLGATWARAR